MWWKTKNKFLCDARLVLCRPEVFFATITLRDVVVIGFYCALFQVCLTLFMFSEKETFCSGFNCLMRLRGIWTISSISIQPFTNEIPSHQFAKQLSSLPTYFQAKKFLIEINKFHPIVKQIFSLLSRVSSIIIITYI